MGKFLDKTYIKAIDSISNKKAENIAHPFYKFMDKAPSTVTYYNVNTAYTKLDEATGLGYDYIESESSFRYNKIEDFVLYGIERIAVQIEAGDYGAESEAIEGEAYIVPNSIKPFPQDYFLINHMHQEVLFKVTSVSLDTIHDGANIYKINYRLSAMDADATNIDNLIIDSYKTIPNNIGTNLAVVLKSTDYDFCEHLEEICSYLKECYRSLFYSDKTQTFVFWYDDKLFYDGYMIQFLKNNKIMSSPELQFLHIDHQVYPGELFPVEYTNTMFYSIEQKDMKRLYNPAMEATLITDNTSLLSTFIEPYYQIHLHKMGARFPVPTFDDDLVRRIREKDFYVEEGLYLRNIPILYFNDLEPDELTLETYEELDFSLPRYELFYNIPLAIYYFESIIHEKLKKLAE